MTRTKLPTTRKGTRRKGRVTHGGIREGAGRKPGIFKTPLPVTVHHGVARAAKQTARILSHSLSSFVEAALVEKLRANGVPIDDILKQTAPITTSR